ncbi:MAG: hypothetical protein H6739_42195 [Alphaproteobacteria bacterium]|nr:hypothetical protein [Alphaproteobacteria bacterium]
MSVAVRSRPLLALSAALINGAIFAALLGVDPASAETSTPPEPVVEPAPVEAAAAQAPAEPTFDSLNDPLDPALEAHLEQVTTAAVAPVVEEEADDEDDEALWEQILAVETMGGY